MRLHLFRTEPLVRELSQGSVGAELQAMYFLASSLFFVLAYYSGLIVSTSRLWSTSSILEGLATIAITVFGIFKSLEAAGGRKSPGFLVEFSCLYVPVAITTYVPVWSLYWVARIGFYEVLMSLSEGHSQFAVNLSQLGTDFFGLLGFIAIVGSQGIVYLRLCKLLRKLRRLERGG